MKTICIYFSDYNGLFILCDGWEITDDKVYFYRRKEIVACFNSNKIIGFIEMDD